MKKNLHYKKSVIYKYDLSGNFVSMYSTCVEAGKDNYLYPRVIEKCCRGEIKHAGNFQWRRVKPNTSTTKKIGKLKASTTYKYLPVEVEQYSIDGEYIKTYPSIRKAAQEVNIDPKNIRQVLKGIQKTAGGYIWKTKD